MHYCRNEDVVGLNLIEYCEGKTTDKTLADFGALYWS
jgi:hypothetical protein